VELQLFDPTGALVAWSYSGSDTERVVHTAAAAGTFTLRVSLDLSADDGEDPGNDYTLVVDMGSE